MILHNHDLAQLDRIKRLNLINSVTGIKPANLIGTVSNAGQTNLAIFSSVVHLGSNPALLGFVVRPSSHVRRHTFENIIENKLYTINHVHPHFVERAHYTSAKFAKEVSEFDACRLTAEYIDGFKAPFVKQSRIKLGMELVEQAPLEINGTVLVIGVVRLLVAPDEVVDAQGHIDLARADDVGISGLNSYYRLDKIADYPYARPEDLPDFSESSTTDEEN